MARHCIGELNILFDPRKYSVYVAIGVGNFSPDMGTSRVSPFRLKKIFAYKRNKANLDQFHLCFTISL